MCDVWRRCYDYSKVSKWFVKFCAGDFLLDNVPWPSRPVEVDSNQIKTLIENNQCYIIWKIADILKISKLSTENHLTISVMLIALMFGFHIRRKNLLTTFPHAILFKHNENAFVFQNKLWQAMKSGYCEIMWNGRDGGASEMNHH